LGNLLEENGELDAAMREFVSVDLAIMRLTLTLSAL
jgi:hypothetical protein